MMNLSTFRIWYTRLFVLLFLGASYFLLIRSSDGGIFGFDSTFWGQRKLIAQFADLRLSLGDRVFPNVLVGEDGWMIFTAERSMDDYQNQFTFTDEQIVRITNQLAELQSRLAVRGATLLVVIVPNKPTVYPEIVPGEIEKLSNKSRLERLAEHLQKKLPGVLLDLRPILSQGRMQQEVYYKADTHWNDYGVFLAYEAILQELMKSHPEFAPYSLDEFELTENDTILGDLAANIGSLTLQEPALTIKPRFENPASYRQMEAGSRRILTASTGNQSLPRLLMYYDSFGPRLFNLLGMHFSAATAVPHYSGRPIWSMNWIDEQNPDVVIIEIAERYLHDLEILLNQ